MKGVMKVQKAFPSSVVIFEDFESVSLTHLLMAHSTNYYERLKTSVPETDEPQHATQYLSQPDNRNLDDFDTFMSANSLKAALYAAGSICCAIDQVWRKKNYNHFSVLIFNF